jgi:transposase InsO family protein
VHRPGSEQRGAPQALRCDNGSEFTSWHLIGWCEEKKIECIYYSVERPRHLMSRDSGVDVDPA